MTSNQYLDASAVVSFFLMTGKKHLFLTGGRGSGKSFLCRAISQKLAAGQARPFSHLLSQKTDDNRVVMHSDLICQDTEYVIGKLPADTPSCGASNRMTPMEEGFQSCGIPAIQAHLLNASGLFIIIDELGYLESSCPPFQSAVRTVLNNSRVIAVLRKQETPFLDELRAREDALVIDLDAPFQSLACLLMASGMSKRFGSNKLLASFGDRTLFENAVRISRFADFGASLAVTIHPEVAALCEQTGVSVLLHALPDRNDMIRLGLSKLLHTADPEGILFLPSDQPLLSQTSLQLLCLSFLYHRDKICRLSADGVGASPIIFPKRYFDELLSLPEKKGGSFLAKKYPEQVRLIPARDTYELSDVDTPQELTQLLRYLR